MALGVDSFVYFANVCNDYHWGYFGKVRAPPIEMVSGIWFWRGNLVFLALALAVHRVRFHQTRSSRAVRDLLEHQKQ